MRAFRPTAEIEGMLAAQATMLHHRPMEAGLRDDAKHAMHEVKPGVGVQSFHADPSTPEASAGFDPLTQASEFLSHVIRSAQGIVGRAVDGGTEHSHGVDHGVGAWMRAQAPSGLRQVTGRDNERVGPGRITLPQMAGAEEFAPDDDPPLRCELERVRAVLESAVRRCTRRSPQGRPASPRTSVTERC